MPNPKVNDKNYWKETILEIDDASTLIYIQDLCRARLDIGNADKKVDGKRPYNSYDYPSPVSKDEEPEKASSKLEPIMKMDVEEDE